MLILLRLANRSLISGAMHCNTFDFLKGARHASKVMLVPQLSKPKRKETHDEHNMKRNRPQSPHLTIYAVELPSTLSITHRMTGVVLSVYTASLGFSALLLPDSFECYVSLLESLLDTINLYPYTVYLLKFILAFPFCFHLCNGIRHLVWDLGVLLSLKGVYATGYLMLLTSFSLAITAALYVIC